MAEEYERKVWLEQSQGRRDAPADNILWTSEDEGPPLQIGVSNAMGSNIGRQQLLDAGCVDRLTCRLFLPSSAVHELTITTDGILSLPGVDTDLMIDDVVR